MEWIVYLILGIGILLGYGLVIWGAILSMKSGVLFYKSRSGIWYPRDPRSLR